MKSTRLTKVKVAPRLPKRDRKPQPCSRPNNKGHGPLIYKIVTPAEWSHAVATGVYLGSEHDIRDGFIHFSTAAQLRETARKYFSGKPDLLLIAADADRWTSSKGQDECEPAPVLRWEPSRGGDLFPHLYAPLWISDVRTVTPLALGQDDVPTIPSELSP